MHFSHKKAAERTTQSGKENTIHAEPSIITGAPSSACSPSSPAICDARKKKKGPKKRGKKKNAPPSKKGANFDSGDLPPYRSARYERARPPVALSARGCGLLLSVGMVRRRKLRTGRSTDALGQVDREHPLGTRGKIIVRLRPLLGDELAKGEKLCALPTARG